MVSSLASCLRDEPVIRGEDGIPAGTYEMDSPNAFSTKLEGLSAICMNGAGNGVYVAEDNGHIYEFTLEGVMKKEYSFPAPDDAHDWEGIAKAKDGTIYLCDERERAVYVFSADKSSVSLLSKGPYEDGGQENQGFEGIAAGNGVLYAANQSLPKRVYSYSLSGRTWETAFDANWATSLSDIFYDEDDGTLWITDAKTQKLTQLSANGTVLKEYDISFVKKPEGFCKDSSRNQFWFVCDKDSKLYKVSYK